MSESPKVQYYNRHSERFEAFYANRSDNWRIKSLTREDMANNLGEHVVETLEADPENYIISSSPNDSLAYIALNRSAQVTDPYGNVSTGTMVIDKIAFKENHKVWGLS